MTATATKAKKSKPRKTLSIVVEGVVERADVTVRDPYHINHYRLGEEKEFTLDVCVRLADGSAAYFHSPAAKRTVVSCCGDGIAAAVVCHTVEGGAKDWFTEENRDKSVATPGVPAENRLVPTVKVGDRVRVMGRLKAHKVSKYGTRYVSLSHVWRNPPADAVSDPLPPPTLPA